MATKTFYHNVPNSSYTDKKGVTHYFKGGQFTTDDPDIIADLDAVIAGGARYLRDKPADKPAPDTKAVPAKDLPASASAADKAAKAAADMVAANAAKVAQTGTPAPVR